MEVKTMYFTLEQQYKNNHITHDTYICVKKWLDETFVSGK